MENFTAKDISTIIKACQNSGVSSLDCGGLKLSFHISEPELDPAPIQGGLQLAQLPDDNEKELLDRQIEENEELRELQLQTMMIEDPEAYEQHMRYEDETS